MCGARLYTANQRPEAGSRDLSRPISGQCPDFGPVSAQGRVGEKQKNKHEDRVNISRDRVISDQSEASIQLT